MFFGTHGLRMDEKGRVALPSRFRDRLPEGLVMAKGQERCVAVFPVAFFERRGEELSRQSQSNPRMRDYQRLLFASADDPMVDKQGRVVVNADLRGYAGLDRDCVAIGANSHFEIWNRPSWEAFLADREPHFASLEEEVMPAVM
ncbi:MAG: division/cell wall cluster transcriptional repressor MraZ [Geodermatophilaceae bacterium]|nr:division/cell wall cluster transcriptional repressor MraZ [Geodermatophilaceae bacterium]